MIPTIRGTSPRPSHPGRGTRGILGLAATLLVLAGAPSPTLAGVTYYVDQNHPLASDSNSGTEDLPFKTIQKAADVVLPGDTVIVKPGTYAERVVFGPSFRGGTADAPIVFRAEPRRSVTMYGFTEHSYATSHHVRIYGFRITQGPTTGNRAGIFLGAWGTRLQGVWVVDNYCFDLQSTISGCIELVSDGAYVAQNEVFQSPKGMVVSGDGFVVEDNRVTRLKQWSSGADTDYMRFFGSNGIIRRNFFANTILTPEWIGSSHVDCFQSWSSGGPVRNIVIEGNVCADGHQGVFVERKEYPFTDLVVRNNVLLRIGAWGVAGGAKGTATEGVINLLVYNNTFAHISLYGVGCGAYSTCEVRNNVFYDVKTPYMSNQATSLVVSHNLLYATFTSFSTWTAQGNVLDQDPQVVDVGSATNDGSLGDWHLRATSPAVDAGIALVGFSQDFDGTPRPQAAAWDMGAYERASTGQSPAAPTGLRVQPVQ